MKIASMIARYLLGLMFTIFGLNGFLHFIPQPPPPNPVAIQILVAVSTSHFAAFFFALQVLGGLLLLLFGFFVPLALTLLGLGRIGTDTMGRLLRKRAHLSLGSNFLTEPGN